MTIKIKDQILPLESRKVALDEATKKEDKQILIEQNHNFDAKKVKSIKETMKDIEGLYTQQKGSAGFLQSTRRMLVPRSERSQAGSEFIKNMGLSDSSDNNSIELSKMVAACFLVLYQINVEYKNTNSLDFSGNSSVKGYSYLHDAIVGVIHTENSELSEAEVEYLKQGLAALQQDSLLKDDSDRLKQIENMNLSLSEYTPVSGLVLN